MKKITTNEVTLDHPMFKESAKALSKDASEKLLGRVNSIIATDENGEFFEQSLTDYTTLIKDKRYNAEQYVNAVRYCSLKMIMSKHKAWGRTFPDRLARVEQKARDGYWDNTTFINTCSAYATTYERSPLVVAIDAEMLIPTHLLYASHRNRAVEKLIDLMDGKSAPSMAYVYEKDDNGKYERDEYGRKIKVLDEYGKPVIEEFLQTVSPKVQGEMASKLLDITEIPADRQVNVDIKHSLSDDLIEAQKRAQETFLSISKGQRELVSNGGSLDDAQQIGNAIEASIIGDEDDIGEDTYYDD